MSSILLFALFHGEKAYGLAFTPTEAEWQTWGEMCQARYVVSGAGSNSAFTQRISPERVLYWRRKIGQEGWRDLHHFCAGIAREKRGEYGHASADIKYTLNRLPADHFLYPMMAARVSNIYSKSDRLEEAEHYAALAIEKNPKVPDGYIVLSRAHAIQSNHQEAINVLENGYKMTDGKFAELNYHLGLAYLKSGDLDNAQKYAKSAYSLGYPLPWLRDQLIKEGKWN